MEAGLYALIFHVAAVLRVQVVKHLTENVLQAYLQVPIRFACCADGMESGVVDVKSGAVEMARPLSSVLVGKAQTSHIGL